MRRLLCKIFGHRMPLKGWWGDGRYGRVIGGRTDGTGRKHFAVLLECPRCRESWVVSRFHGADREHPEPGPWAKYPLVIRRGK